MWTDKHFVSLFEQNVVENSTVFFSLENNEALLTVKIDETLRAVRNIAILTMSNVHHMPYWTQKNNSHSLHFYGQ